MTSPGPEFPVGVVVMEPDCTVRSIGSAYQAIRGVRPADAAVRVDCGAVEQADIAFVQLIVSAQATWAARDVRLTVDPAPACLHAAFGRSGIEMPGAGRRHPS